MDDLRKLAAETLGREYFAPKQLSALDTILLQKQAGMDLELAVAAATLDPDHVLETYEKLGGSYKTALEASEVRKLVSSAITPAGAAGKKRLLDFASRVQGMAQRNPGTALAQKARSARSAAMSRVTGGL